MREWIKRSKPDSEHPCACGVPATWTLISNGVYDYCDKHQEKSERSYAPLEDSDLEDSDDSNN